MPPTPSLLFSRPPDAIPSQSCNQSSQYQSKEALSLNPNAGLRRSPRSLNGLPVRLLPKLGVSLSLDSVLDTNPPITSIALAIPGDDTTPTPNPSTLAPMAEDEETESWAKWPG